MPDTSKIKKLKSARGVSFVAEPVKGMFIKAEATAGRGTRFHFTGTTIREPLCLADMVVWKENLVALIDEVAKHRTSS